MAFVALSLAALSILQQASSLVVPRQCPDDTAKPVAAAYYAGWHATEGFPLSSVSWHEYNTLIYSFAATAPNVNNLSLTESDASLLPQFVSQAHENGVAAHIAIGGWSGGRYFSSNVATPENRTAFVKTVAAFVEEYDLDGINFDWEYPNKQGVGCNTISANDTENYLAFIQELRAAVGTKLTLSASTPLIPFNDPSGKPIRGVSGFAKALDYIAIMNYDVWGSWDATVGANAPLNDTCAPPADQQGSAVSAVKAWSDAGMPLNKIVLGVAAYGHSFSVSPWDAFVNGSTTQLAPYPKFNASNQPLGDSWDNTSGDDVCGVFQQQGGTWRLWSLITDNFLTPDGSVAEDIYYRYDECSQTPFVYNKTSEVMISFDDARSFAAKGNFIKNTGLRGFAMWEAGGDYNNTLLHSIRAAAGFS